MAAAFAHLSRWNEPCEVTVYVKSPHARFAVEKLIPNWIANGWVNARGEAVNGWYKALSENMTGHQVQCAEYGEYSSWLETNMKHTRGEKLCLITLENLTAGKNSTEQPRD
jgi:ribonuclease HI